MTPHSNIQLLSPPTTPIFTVNIDLPLLIGRILEQRWANPRRKELIYTHFLNWYQTTSQVGMSSSIVHAYLGSMIDERKGHNSINEHLSAVKRLAYEAFLDESISPSAYARIREVRKLAITGRRLGNWLSREQALRLLNSPDISILRGSRDRAVLALLLGCGLRRQEVVTLTFDHLQKRQNRWLIVDLMGKKGKVRSIPMAFWTKDAIDHYTNMAQLSSGFLIRPVDSVTKIRDSQMSAANIWMIIKRYAHVVDISDLSPHHLRKTYAKLARKGGSELEQIQLTLGHESLRTTQIYLGSSLDLERAPADLLGLSI